MEGDASVKGFLWKHARTEAHGHLLKTLRKAMEDLGIPASARILDAGCGGGFLMNELWMAGFKDIRGFDLSESGIKLARESFPALSGRFEVHDAFCGNLPESFAQSGYDLVLSVEVLEHLYDPMQYLENVRRWLKNGGTLILSAPYHGYLKNLALALAGGFDRHFDPLNHGGHIKFWSKDTIYKLMETTGIRPLKFYGSGRLPLLWKSMVVAGRND